MACGTNKDNNRRGGESRGEGEYSVLGSGVVGGAVGENKSNGRKGDGQGSVQQKEEQMRWERSGGKEARRVEEGNTPRSAKRSFPFTKTMAQKGKNIHT